MHGRPPPIQLLASFEAAARLGGFKLAAAELSVTASAISQQVRALEDFLDMTLFVRHVRRIELSEAGEAYYQVAYQTLNLYATKYATFMHQFDTPQLRISMLPFVAYELVIPNLLKFNELYPDIDLRIEATMHIADFNREPIDAGIRFGRVGSSDSVLERHSLGDCYAALVIQPELLERTPLKDPEDLKQHTIIHFHDESGWLEAANHSGLEKFEVKNELFVDSYFAALLAAEKGLGVAIGIFPITDDWVSSGRLVCVIDKVAIDREWYFAFPRNHKKKQQLMYFYDWLKADMFK